MNVVFNAKAAVFFLAIALALYLLFLYPWFMNWGATAAEQAMPLPGDELMGGALRYFTRAITIHAPVSEVWPWIVQMGQDRGGFYSNTWLENLTGADIHNADQVWPQWQHREVGDWVRLARPNLFGGIFANFARTRILVLTPEEVIANIPTRFVLQPIDSKNTRLLMREPLPASLLTRSVLALTWNPAHFVMEQRMLRGIKERAEGVPLVPLWLIWVARIGWLLAFAAIPSLLDGAPHGRLWTLVPFTLGVLIVWFTGDWNSAIAAFLAVGITLAGFLSFGRQWWPTYLILATVIAYTLLLAPEPYIGCGILLGTCVLPMTTALFRALARGGQPAGMR